MDRLKRDLFNILAYIVEPKIKDKGIDKVIKTQILPAIKRYIRRKKKS